MKNIICILALLTIASAQVFPYSVSSDCSSVGCDRSYWYANNTQYSMACPKSGTNQAQFRQTYNNSLYLDINTYNMFSSDSRVTLPLVFNYQASSSGVQYSTQVDTNSFVTILNCTLPAARQLTSLCNYHQLVGAKFINNVFQSQCAYGLDYSSRSGFLQASEEVSEEVPLNNLNI